MDWTFFGSFSRLRHIHVYICHDQVLAARSAEICKYYVKKNVPGTTTITFLRHVVIHLHTVQLVDVPLFCKRVLSCKIITM